MKAAISKSWNRSVQPRKQRKFVHNAPLHIKPKIMLISTLSKELRKKHNKRNMRLRKGDTVKIMRGQFKGKKGKVDEIETKKDKIYIEGIEHIKKDGTKAFYPLKASNLMITELNLDDKKRKKILARKNPNVKENKNG
ncbi:MAG: 50S ribosomal protein L24 [Candidatus Woesearchaeota archaeon]